MKRLTVILVALGLLAASRAATRRRKPFRWKRRRNSAARLLRTPARRSASLRRRTQTVGTRFFSAPDSVTLADKTFNIGFIAAPDAAGNVGGLQITRTAAQEDAEAEGALALEVYDLLVESFGEPDRPDGASDSLYFADADAEALAGGAVGRDTWTLDDGTTVSYVAGIQNEVQDGEEEAAPVFSHLIAIGG